MPKKSKKSNGKIEYEFEYDFESIEKSDEKLKLISKMEKEMKAAAARLDFERAAQIRDRIYQLENPTN